MVRLQEVVITLAVSNAELKSVQYFVNVARVTRPTADTISFFRDADINDYFTELFKTESIPHLSTTIQQFRIHSANLLGSRFLAPGLNCFCANLVLARVHVRFFVVESMSFGLFAKRDFVRLEIAR